MKIIIAPNAFKGSLTAREAADHIARGIGRVLPEAEVVRIPLSDGGDGLIDVLMDTLKGVCITCRVSDPLGNPVDARYGWVEDRAIALIEMAEASGLMRLAEHERDPLRTSTRGTGELMMDALDRGAGKLVIGIGGSATNDGGTGMAMALGAQFLDARGREVDPCGGNLRLIEAVRPGALPGRLERIEIEAICDVENPLLGPEGAAHVYAPQKGASPEGVERLEEGMRHLASVVQRDLGRDMNALSGGGAAGGLGAGLYAFAGATLKPGADAVLELLDVAKAMEGADLVLTGEGRLDDQTLSGKAPARVAALARKKGIVCIALAGMVEGDGSAFSRAGFHRILLLRLEGESIAESMSEARERIADAAERIASDFL